MQARPYQHQPRVAGLHSDVSNFFVDTKGNTCLLDCEDVGLLPASFASYTMCSTLQPFATEVAKYFDWPISSNINSMIRIGGILWMIADPTLGKSTYT